MFRFTIRDLLWLMVVAGLGVGWWMEHRQAIDLRVGLREEKARNDAVGELNKRTMIYCSSMPLKDVALYLSRLHNIPVTLASSVNRNTMITCNFTNVSLRVALQGILTEHGLDFRVQDGGILIEPKSSWSPQTLPPSGVRPPAPDSN
jgi:hypothetical protein